MKNLQKIALSLLFILAALGLQAQKTQAQPNPEEETWLWQISGNGLSKPSYLFGTIHVLCPDDFILSDGVLEKLNKSKQLVLEVADAENPANLMLVLESMTMKGKKLKDLYTEEEYAELKQFFKDSLNSDIETLASFSPMFTMTSVLPAMLGCTEIKSYESELTALARKQGKEVKDVETLQQQLSIFDTIPYHIQAQELLRTVRNWAKEKQTFRVLVDIYINQQFQYSQAFIHSTMGDMTEYEDVLLTNRNKQWIPKIKAYAAEKPTFFAFGAGHLSGTNGLIELLRKEGYTVTPIKN